MSRYIATDVIKDESGKRRKATTIFPAIPASPNDTYIITTSMDRLDKIAYTFYEDQSLWWVIAAANGLGKGTLVVPSNTKLRIPVRQEFFEQVTLTNRTR